MLLAVSVFLFVFGLPGYLHARDDKKDDDASPQKATKGRSDRGGITPPGGNNNYPQYFACSSGATSFQSTLSAAETACGGGPGSVWFPALRKDESFIDMAIMVKF